jgi:hypothetical protein
MRIVCRILGGKHEGKTPLDLGVNVRIMCKWMLQKKDARMWG